MILDMDGKLPPELEEINLDQSDEQTGNYMVMDDKL
jgi:hypothetical protein